MKEFESYIEESKIILLLCRIRAKYAQQRSKKHLIHLLSSSDNFNYHLNSKKENETEDKDLILLNSILPSRRQWKKPKKNKRYKVNNQRINSVDYNVESLLLTIEYYKKKLPNEPFLLNLNLFIADLRHSMNDPHYKIQSPVVIPKLKGIKKHDKNKCRPISMFSLKDRLIISLTNKYYTEVFDKYFYDHSYAFRSVKNVDGEKFAPSHHDAIQKIQQYKQNYKGKRLWVAECDIGKFYDSVHHTVVRKHFKNLISILKKDNPKLYDARAEGLFYKYLDCYSFVKNVLPLNDKKNKKYWEEKNIPGGHFGWVEKELLSLKYFKSLRNAKIGVPQGGALSGLIANIVLNYADKMVLKSSDARLLYLRFCDDMVIIHPSKKKCVNASNEYFKSLKDLHLVPHEFTPNLKNTPDSFWSGEIKSKYPYCWSTGHRNSFPWFGFVGYEIHYDGGLRVRKSSMIKEKKKQKETVNEIIKAVKRGKRKNDGTIFESAANRLIGMSVGRLELSNYNEVENEMCWVNGFKKLDDHMHLRVQLKELDRYRNQQLSNLLKTIEIIKLEDNEHLNKRIGKKAFIIISGISESDSEEIRNQLVTSGILNPKFRLKDGLNFEDSSLNLGLSENFEKYRAEIIRVLVVPSDNRKPIYYGKPFSYYYQVIERSDRKVQ
jgi:hypothetical protein